MDNLSVGYKLLRDEKFYRSQALNRGLNNDESIEWAKAMAKKDFMLALEWKRWANTQLIETDATVENWYSINIRPKPGVYFKDFLYLCHEFCKRKMFIHGEYVFEQKGESEETMGEGFHMHLTAICKYAKSKILTDTLSTFKKYAEPQGIKIIKIKTKADLERRNLYLRGQKVGEDKQKAIPFDALWRKREGLADIYQVQ